MATKKETERALAFYRDARIRAKAQSRAKTQLIKAHKEEYDKLYQEIKVKLENEE